MWLLPRAHLPDRSRPGGGRRVDGSSPDPIRPSSSSRRGFAGLAPARDRRTCRPSRRRLSRTVIDCHAASGCPYPMGATRGLRSGRCSGFCGGVRGGMNWAISAAWRAMTSAPMTASLASLSSPGQVARWVDWSVIRVVPDRARHWRSLVPGGVGGARRMGSGVGRGGERQRGTAPDGVAGWWVGVGHAVSESQACFGRVVGRFMIHAVSPVAMPSLEAGVVGVLGGGDTAGAGCGGMVVFLGRWKREVSVAGEGLAIRPWRRFASEDECRRWAEAVAGMVTVDRVSRLIVVAGTCPACGHLFEQRISDRHLHEEPWAGGARGGLPWLKRDGGVKWDWGGKLRFLAACFCDQPHPQRPSVISHGCGASGWLEDTPG